MNTKSSFKNPAADLLALADIQINGARPWDIQVYDERLYARIWRGGSLAFGESYMDGWWDCSAIDEMVTRLLKIDVKKYLRVNPGLVWQWLRTKLTNEQRATKAFEIGERHYDIGNDLYELMLDDRMTYTCGYWKNAVDLNSAQEAKLDLVCKKIGLQPGMTVLDIGCGWGSFARFAAEKYGAVVTGITVSKEQCELAQTRCAGLPIKIILQDYREMNEKFDRVISLGMFEHVGPKNYRTYMQVAHRNLKNDGLFLLHTIGGNTSTNRTDPWIEKYIFPNSVIPSAKQIAGAVEGLFVMEDWHNFGTDYDKTLLAWYQNVQRGWDKIKNNYNDRFFRMWKFYLLSCAGSFRARHNNLWQIVFSKNRPGGYESIR